MLQAGKLRHRVTLQRQAETQDSATGAVVVSWQNVATVWAAIEPVSAREFIASQSEVSRVTTRITIRYRSDITSKMRLYHSAKDAFYNIEGVLSDKDSGLEYITLPCSEGVRYLEGEPEAVVPVILISPVISGTPTAGQTLTVNNGTWANDPASYLYQWYVNDIPVMGQTANSWLTAASVNDIITASVAATNSAGSSNPVFTAGRVVT